MSVGRGGKAFKGGKSLFFAAIMNKIRDKVQLIALFLALVTLAACSKGETAELESPTVTGESISLHLSAEIGFEEVASDLRALDFKLEQNKSGSWIPRPQFADGALVEVHTIIRSNKGAVAIQTLKWRYSETLKSLVLSREHEGNHITIPNFNNDSETKWYMAALLAPGKTLSGANNDEVKLQGVRVLKGVSGNSDRELGKLNVPYWLGWTELLIETFGCNQRDSVGSYSNAKIQSAAAYSLRPAFPFCRT